MHNYHSRQTIAALAASALALATLIAIGYPAHAQKLTYSAIYPPVSADRVLGDRVRPDTFNPAFFGPIESTDELYVLLAAPCNRKSLGPFRILREGTDRVALEIEAKRLSKTSGKICFEVLPEDMD
jgi:hypothetical protein